MRHPALLLVPFLFACQKDEDSGDIPLIVDLSGTLVDGDEAPVADGWILVDDGETLATARSGADGTWVVPGLDGSRTMTMTVAASGYLAFTFTGIVIGEATPDATLHMYGVEGGDSGDEVTVEGTVSNLGEATWGLFYGESAYLGSLAAASDPLPFSFTAPAIPGQDTYGYSVLAIDDSYTLHGAGFQTLQAGEAADLVLSTDLVDVTLTANRPLLDGEPAQEPYDCMGYGAVAADPRFALMTGFNATCETTETTTTYPVRGLVPESGAWALAQVVGGSQDEHYSYTLQPLLDPAVPLELSLLDSPVVGSHGDLAPGESLSFNAAPEGARHTFYVFDRRGLCWMLIPYGDPEVTFPRLPEGFDTNLLFETSGTWYAWAESYEVTEEGEVDEMAPYRAAATYGGDVRGE